jgi:hypothetical protein
VFIFVRLICFREAYSKFSVRCGWRAQPQGLQKGAEAVEILELLREALVVDSLGLQVRGGQNREGKMLHATPHVVWLKYCVASRCLAMVVAEQSTEALPPHHVTRLATNFPLRCDQLIVETLMITFRMIVGQVLLDRIG